MCGIVGYIGDKQAAPLLLDGLKKLEYRGYDSAGLAIVGDDESITVAKERGRLSALYEITNGGEAIRGCVGIGHTRWATHGEPNRINAHPHVSMSGRVALVHNGIIENYAELKAFLIGKGYTFTSETDSEVAVQLIDYYYDGDPMEAVRLAEAQFVGSYAMAIVFADREDEFIALRKDSPLILGLGEGENFIASDAPALLKHTRRIIRLGERELAVVRREGVAIYNSFGERVEHEPINITWDVESAEKNGYDHFMLKEIMEQPDAIRRTVAPRIKNGQIELGLSKIDADVIRSLERVYIVACGSSHADIRLLALNSMQVGDAYTKEESDARIASGVSTHNANTEAHPSILSGISGLDSRLTTLELKYGRNVTGNSFSISFANLTGLVVTGVWNKNYARIEF